MPSADHGGLLAGKRYLLMPCDLSAQGNHSCAVGPSPIRARRPEKLEEPFDVAVDSRKREPGKDVFNGLGLGEREVAKPACRPSLLAGV